MQAESSLWKTCSDPGGGIKGDADRGADLKFVGVHVGGRIRVELIEHAQVERKIFNQLVAGVGIQAKPELFRVIAIEEKFKLAGE